MFFWKKIRIYWFCLISITVVLLSSCGNHKAVDYFTIHGKLKNSLGEKIVLQQLKIDSIKAIDSVKVDENGEFTFKYTPENIGFYVVKISDDNFITILADKGEQIEISANARQLAGDYTISGSSGSALICELNNHTRKNFHKTDSLYELQIQYQESDSFPRIKKGLDSVYEIIFTDQQKYVQWFIEKNKTSLASLMALYQFFGRQKLLNERDHFKYFKLLDSTLFLIYPQNDYVLELHERVKEIKHSVIEKEKNLSRLKPGMPAPEIRMKNIGGNAQYLSSVNGKNTLVLFWAASGKTNDPAIEWYNSIFKKYRDKGFQIYAISLDQERRDWEYAIREKKLNWIHVNDLLGWDSPAVKDYCIDSIPCAVLIDKDGAIVKWGINNEELQDWLSENYKF